ncbi:GAF domain-containing sensor histidine kinase [Mucilaginibacter sp. ZT4R22]|uniref:histidine kinase n=1 Tax=Mucilaginibacter pankratovii TaxID=2772110 RepID=A0ABR7WKJ6_9SPHI|nr:GAF domain-containing sensor histidine kinase [Mucilaginibacter pankratovii]MBD1362850.1 GAF domain-containing sensor histidine kinase [Mucilaginibacter pankratovii]
MSNLSYPLPENEDERLEALASYNILDTMPEDDFEELTHLASEICQTSVALISLLDDKRQWFKAILGHDVRETPREYAFCSHTILNKNDIMVVPDARKDERFLANPLVTGNPNIVFYAGVPLVNEDGFALGSLCVIDTIPKELNARQLKSLRILAKQVITQMELRRKLARLERSNQNLLETNSFIQKFASTAAHDIKNPLSSMLLTSQALQMRLGKSGDDKSKGLLDLNITSTKRLLTLVDEMLAYSSKPSSLLTNQKCLELNTLLKNVVSLIDVPYGVKINLPQVDHTLTCSSVALEQIFINLLTNAIRYNDKEAGIITIQFREEGDFYNFKVTDNGMGIAEKNLGKIFYKEVTLDVIDRFNQKGTGVGLYTVKALVEKLKGSIKVDSHIGSGTTFTFSVKKNAGVGEDDELL